MRWRILKQDSYFLYILTQSVLLLPTQAAERLRPLFIQSQSAVCCWTCFCLLRLFLRPSSPPLCLPRLRSVLDSVQIEATVPPSASPPVPHSWLWGRLPRRSHPNIIRPPTLSSHPDSREIGHFPPKTLCSPQSVFKPSADCDQTKPLDCVPLCACPPILPTGHPPDPRGRETQASPALAVSFPPTEPRTSFSQRRPASSPLVQGLQLLVEEWGNSPDCTLNTILIFCHRREGGFCRNYSV